MILNVNKQDLYEGTLGFYIYEGRAPLTLLVTVPTVYKRLLHLSTILKYIRVNKGTILIQDYL